MLILIYRPPRRLCDITLGAIINFPFWQWLCMALTGRFYASNLLHWNRNWHTGAIAFASGPNKSISPCTLKTWVIAPGSLFVKKNVNRIGRIVNLLQECMQSTTQHRKHRNLEKNIPRNDIWQFSSIIYKIFHDAKATPERVFSILRY